MKPLRLGFYLDQGEGADGIWMRRGMIPGTRAIFLTLNLWPRSNG
jgi:hypothetical protein